MSKRKQWGYWEIEKIDNGYLVSNAKAKYVAPTKYHVYRVLLDVLEDFPKSEKEVLEQ